MVHEKVKPEDNIPPASQDLDGLKICPDDIFFTDHINPIYHAKAQILNDAVQRIGMGKYQWHLFIVTGFGWLADNLWPIVTGLILSPVVNEFHVDGPFLKLGQNIGLLLGAVFWGVGISFNITLLIIGIFATAAGGSQDYITLISFTTIWSIGVGGNLPVDSSIFLEFVPASHQYLLTVLSIWWSVGQLLGSLVAWPLIGKFSCPTTDPLSECPGTSNQGWRYFLFAMGGLMLLLWSIRFFAFQLHESPKYLMGKGKDQQAVDIMHKLADYNGKTIYLTVEQLSHAGAMSGHVDNNTFNPSAFSAVKGQMRKFGTDHLRALFATRKLAYSTSILIVLWALIGLAFPLYNGFVTYYLATRGVKFGDSSVYITYRNQVILSVIGVPGALLAGWLVELPILGRRRTLVLSTILTGVFILTSTTARTSNALLGWNCGYSFTSNVMYGVLYALSPEVFPTKDRGTGNALVAGANRIFGIMAPLVALYANLATSAPIFVSGALFVTAGLVALLLPYEPRGKATI